MKIILQTVTLLILVTSLTGCIGQYVIADNTIWDGYANITTPSSDESQDAKALRIEHLQQQYSINKLGSNTITLPNAQTTGAAIPPIPHSLMNKTGSIIGQQIHVRIISKHNRNEVAVLSFIKWDGTSEWWVREVGSGLWKRAV